MRNLSSWGMHQFEIFHEKSSFSKIMYLIKHKGVTDRANKLEVPTASCLVHRVVMRLFKRAGSHDQDHCHVKNMYL